MNNLQIIQDICVGSREENRNALCAYEEVAKTMPQVEIPVLHYMHGGMYAREITIPKNTILTGAIYKFNHLDIMVSGDVTVSTDTGETKRLTGYNCLKGLSGKKRAGVTHEDTVWLTIHAIQGACGDDIQRFLTVDTFEDLEVFMQRVNTVDYELLLSEPRLDHAYELNLEGRQADKRVLASEVVCAATREDNYLNHAVDANCKFINLSYVALRDIEPGEELTINYRQVLAANTQGDIWPV